MRLSIVKFRKWLGAQEPDKTYTYANPRGCPIASWLVAEGYPDVIVGGETYSLERHGKNYKIPKKLDELVREGERTYGSLYARACAK